MKPLDHAVMAVKTNHPEILALFIPQIDLTAIPTGEACPLIELASALERWECVSLLVKSNKNNAADGAHYGAVLIHAVTSNNIQIARLLLNAGAPTHWEDKAGDSAMHLASRNSNVEMVELLLSYGAAVNKKNKKGETPFNLQKTLDKSLENGWLNYLERESQNGLLVLLIVGSQQKASKMSKLSDPILNLIFTFFTPPKFIPKNKNLITHGKDLLKRALPEWYNHGLFKNPRLIEPQPQLAQPTEPSANDKRKSPPVVSDYSLRKRR